MLTSPSTCQVQRQDTLYAAKVTLCGELLEFTNSCDYSVATLLWLYNGVLFNAQEHLFA